MRRHILTFLFLAAFTVGSTNAQTMISKNDLSMGVQFAYLDLDSDNSDLFLIISPVTANGSFFHVAPFFEYAYRDDRSIGAKFQYLVGTAQLDNLSLDLMNEGMTFEVEDIDTRLKRISAFFYHRNYLALDRRSRIGVIIEESLSYARTHTDYDYDAPGTRFSTGDRFTLAFSPGLAFFVMNNLSLSFTLSLANVSYNTIKSYTSGEESGSREKFGGRFGVDITGINFEISFHF